jgi:hypothetical protein
MAKKQRYRISGLLMIFLFMILTAGCEALGKSAALLISGTYEVPTPYVTPLAQGTAYISFTPYPQGSPVFDKESCTSVEGYSFRLDLQIQYDSFRELRGTTGETSRQDLPPVIDEMRKLHDDVRAMEPPAACEIYADLQYHVGAEIDQTIRAFVSFRNGEPNEVMMDYFNEAFAHEAVVEKILSMTN